MEEAVGQGTEHERESLRDAAIHAEYETGLRESTERAAKAHVLVRVVRTSLGTVVTTAGLVMMPLPGPGLPIVALGLAILARDVAWADRLLGHVHARIPRDDDGGISRQAMLTMALGGVAGILFSTWWFVIR